MKIEIPSNIKGKELTTFLLANKKALIEQKKSMPMKFTEPIIGLPEIREFSLKTSAIKDILKDDTEDPTDPNKVRVTVVANACYIMDSQYDVLIKDSSKRTIKERKKLLVHLHDHIYRIDAKIGEVVDVYLADIKLSELGLPGEGVTQCIIFVTDVYKSYNEAVYNQYKNKKINQHSIGLQYVDIELAINDPDSEKEYDFWSKYIDQVINKDAAMEAGFFFVIKELRLLENSSVLFGSNAYTPTLEVEGSKSHSGLDIHLDDPSQEPIEKDTDTIKAIREFNFLNN